jgi:molybdenum cofactor biosynthesis protein A
LRFHLRDNNENQATAPGPFLRDGFDRTITYLRLSVTDRCNLRCLYCRPSGESTTLPPEEILSLEELERLVTIFVGMGVRKVRITGGEPLVRKGLLPFLGRLRRIKGLDQICLTSNGTLLAPHLEELKRLQITGINLSLDTLRPQRFLHITGLDLFAEVYRCLHQLLERGIPVKVNAVALRESLAEDLAGLVDLARRFPLEIRLIEQMPFNGTAAASNDFLSATEIWDLLSRLLPDLQPVVAKAGTTARLYSAPGFQGRIGLIAGNSRLFCPECNKVRVTAPGIMKNCLYDQGVLDLKEMFRRGSSDQEIAAAIRVAVRKKARNGFNAQVKGTPRTKESMASIGG